MASFRYVRQVAAPPEVVFDVLTDHRRYTEITPLRKAELEREGEPAPNGLGAIRVLSALPGPPMREEVIGYERPSRFSYKLLSGLPVRDVVALRAEPTTNQPDFVSGQEIGNRTGAGSTRLDFGLKRGILIRGRVIDRVTGQPAQALVEYRPASDNPNIDQER